MGESTGPQAHSWRAWDVDPDLDVTWKLQARCRSTTDMDAFFPGQKGPQRWKEICQGCPVRRECLEYSFEIDAEFGIWGGVSPGLRRELMKRWKAERLEAAS